MYESYPQSINLVLGRSVVGWRLTLGVHGLAALVPFYSSLGLLTLLLWPLLGWSCYRLWQRDYLRTARSSVQQLRLSGDAWRLRSGTGQWIEVALVGEQLILPFLTVLNFVTSSVDSRQRWRVIIFRDAVPFEPYRRLRVHLRMSSSP